MLHLELVKFTNKWLWKSQEYDKNAKEYRQLLIAHIEWLEERLKRTTNKRKIEYLTNKLKNIKEELEQLDIEIEYNRNKQEFYKEELDKYNIYR